MARPSIITDPLIEQFCSSLRVTFSIEVAIKKTGIGRESYYRWKRRVAKGNGTRPERRFIRAVDMADGEMKIKLEMMFSQHCDKSWKALAWWLERKYPAEYGRRRPPPLPDPDAC
jgi:transposase